MSIPNNKPQIDFFNNPQSIGGFNLSGIEGLTTPSKTEQMVNNPVYQDALTSQISEEVQQDPRTLPFYKRGNIAADLGYNEDSMIENINEAMRSGMIPEAASSYDRRVIGKLQKAIQGGLQPNPELIMEAVPEIPYNVAYKIANQQPPKLKLREGFGLGKKIGDTLGMPGLGNFLDKSGDFIRNQIPLFGPISNELTKIVRDIDYVDPTFKYETLEQIQDQNLMGVRGEKPNRDILVEQLSVPEFVFSNGARLLGNLPSAVANAAIFVGKLAFDPEKTISETVQGIAAIPEAVRQDMIKEDNVAGKFQRFIDGTMKFVVENPDIVLAPEAALRGRGVFSAGIPGPMPEGVAPSTIESIVKERLASKGLEQTVENVTKEANTLYNEILENPQSWQDYDVPQDIKNQASVYRGENAQGEVVYRPDTQNIIDDLNIKKDIQETFGQTIRGVRTTKDITKKTNDFITTMELVLDNRDTLPTIFPNGKVSKNITVFDFAEAADVTKNDFWNNIIEPAFSAMDELDIKPTTADMNFLTKTIQKSLDEMFLNGKLTPISKKAYNTIKGYLDIFTTPGITILDLQRQSQQINDATRQFYNGSSMSAANRTEQKHLAGLNIILRDIIDKHTSKLLGDMKMKDLKKQRGAIRGSIEQITKKGQVIDRQATNSLTDVIGSSFGISEVIGGAAFGTPEMIVSGVAMKGIQSYQKYMNSPNRKLRKMLEKIDKYRDGFKVPGGFSSQGEVASQIQSKIDEIVNNYNAQKAAKQRVADIQDDFAKTIQAELVREPVTSIRVAGIEITPEGVIRQPGVETPPPRARSVVEIDQFTPAREAREKAAREAAEMQTKENQRLAELVQKTRADIIDKRLYDFARENGELVQGSDVFNGIKRGDVTQYGIVDGTTIDGTRYKIKIQGMENTISPYDVMDGVYRLSEDPRDVLMRITEEVDEALSEKPTTESMKALVKKMQDELGDTEVKEKTTDPTEPQGEAYMRTLKVEDKPAGEAPDTPLNEFIDEMEETTDRSLMNADTENFSTEGFGVSRATAAAEVLDYIGVEGASLDTLVQKMSKLPTPISNEVQRIARMRNPEKALEAAEKLKVEYQDMLGKPKTINANVSEDVVMVEGPRVSDDLLEEVKVFRGLDPKKEKKFIFDAFTDDKVIAESYGSEIVEKTIKPKKLADFTNPDDALLELVRDNRKYSEYYDINRLKNMANAKEFSLGNNFYEVFDDPNVIKALRDEGYDFVKFNDFAGAKGDFKAHKTYFSTDIKQANTTPKTMNDNVSEDVVRVNVGDDILMQEARKYDSAEEFIKNTKKTPETANVWVKSKFSDKGAYMNVPIIRKVENTTLYQGGDIAENRQFRTKNKEYARQFGELKEKTSTFYQVDNGNRVTDVYIEAEPQLRKIREEANK